MSDANRRSRWNQSDEAADAIFLHLLDDDIMMIIGVLYAVSDTVIVVRRCFLDIGFLRVPQSTMAIFHLGFELSDLSALM